MLTSASPLGYLGNSNLRLTPYPITLAAYAPPGAGDAEVRATDQGVSAQSQIGDAELKTQGDVDKLDGAFLPSNGSAVTPYRFGTEQFAAEMKRKGLDQIRYFADDQFNRFPGNKGAYFKEYKGYYYHAPTADWLFFHPFAIQVDYSSSAPVSISLTETTAIFKWTNNQWVFDPEVTKLVTGKDPGKGTDVTVTKFSGYEPPLAVFPLPKGKAYNATYGVLKQPTGAKGQFDRRFVFTDVPALYSPSDGDGIKETVTQVLSVQTADGKSKRVWEHKFVIWRKPDGTHEFKSLEFKEFPNAK